MHALDCIFHALTGLANALKQEFDALSCLLHALKQAILKFAVKFFWRITRYTVTFKRYMFILMR